MSRRGDGRHRSPEKASRSRKKSLNVLAAAVLAMTFAVFSLGGVVLYLKLRPAPMPTTKAGRDLSMSRAAVKQNPKNDLAWTSLGLALVEDGQPSAAAAAFERAIGLNSGNWIARFQLALLVKASNQARAIALLERASTDAPRTNRAAPLVALGDLYFAARNPAKARVAYEKAIGDVPQLFDAHLGLAKSLEALGDPKGALREYRQAARYDPSNQEVAAAIARLKASG